MRALILVALAGAGAQLVDGSLGMGYGVTSASLLLALGTAPALASASVNVAQLGTTLISGASHARFGNVDWAVVRRLAVPGGMGALAGAGFLSSLSTAAARPLMAVLLVILGLGIIARFVLGREPGAGRLARFTSRRIFLGPLGLVGGFVNATGGGGWGPVVTSTLISTSPLPPRRVIGSVSAAEFVVTVCASVGFLVGLGLAGIDLRLVGALMAGGVVAAPVAARLAGLLPAPVLGICVGGLILALNAGTVLALLGLGGIAATVVEGVLTAAWLALLTRAVVRGRTDRPSDRPEVSRDDDEILEVGR
ncbi:TSUP family transporter [Nostocoides sp. F2B08]|uniref:sulfite exporter TauE/SafE family protein n=1 Tax=Nostocoides sp. F2B08 TaxID=2653936 RepID=UPI001263B14B|nr:sulfite exporter TauE/SafE family protein [Tetrasphaera sp. F2B08]KAB7746345.1 TSUP family transporter [Tetrasphaera sp. F2B08]